MKKKTMEFILAILTKLSAFFSKLRCACCNSQCVIDKSVNCPEKKDNDNINVKTS